ncbi:MAG: hypothetical protein ACOYEH_09190, partial [Caldicoprobacterales bacterium]
KRGESVEIFQDLGRTIEQVARQVGEKSEEVWEAGKLKIEIFKQEDAIRKLYRKIGEQVSAQYSKGQQYDERTNEFCAEIQERKKKIEQYKAKLGDLRKTEKQSEKQPDKQSEEQKQQQILRTSECSPNGPEMTFNEAVANMQKKHHDK